MGLEGIDEHSAIMALRVALKECKFFPTPAVLREIVSRLKRNETMTKELPEPPDMPPEEREKISKLMQEYREKMWPEPEPGETE